MRILKKTFIIFETDFLEFVKVKKAKIVRKLRLLGCILTIFSKNYRHIWNQHSWIFKISDVCVKVKTDEKCPIWVFWEAFSENGCHIWNQRLQTGLIAEFGADIKPLNLGWKILNFRYFWLKLKNTIVIFKISTLEFA